MIRPFLSRLRDVRDEFRTAGITPLVPEPLPNALHDHIKAGDALRDSCTDKFMILLKNLRETGVTTDCLNFMAHCGWTRTADAFFAFDFTYATRR